MFSFLVSIFAGRFFKTAEGEIKAGWHWLFSSATHLLEAALLCAVLWGWYERHEAGKYERAEHSSEVARQADGKVWSQAFGVERGSVVTLTGALHEQNAAVARLKTESDKQIAANHAAVQKLAERAKSAEAMSARMKAALASGGAQGADGGPCKSDDSFMAAAKGGAL